MWQSGIYGTIFFDDNVTKERYLQMFQEKIWPLMQADGRADSILFMHDGAPPHWGIFVRNWLNNKMPQRWMGHGSPNMTWPPRSPDLTACDFFLWGFVKSNIYKSCPSSVLH